MKATGRKQKSLFHGDSESSIKPNNITSDIQSGCYTVRAAWSVIGLSHPSLNMAANLEGAISFRMIFRSGF
jgi:hypothetical protein